MTNRTGIIGTDPRIADSTTVGLCNKVNALKAEIKARRENPKIAKVRAQLKELEAKAGIGVRELEIKDISSRIKEKMESRGSDVLVRRNKDGDFLIAKISSIAFNRLNILKGDKRP